VSGAEPAKRGGWRKPDEDPNGLFPKLDARAERERRLGFTSPRTNDVP
jgi:hypothetical protein